MTQAPSIAHAGPRAAPFDILRLPLLGRFLRWKRSRMVMQVPLLAVSIIMILHAFWGPPFAPKNLAVLLTWVHFRGLVVIVLLLAGNLFCMACPFMLPRDLIRRWIKPRWAWPRFLKNKWPAVILFVAVLFIYELFDLWAYPTLTGITIVAYFAAAAVIDLLFRGAPFCKHVCPIGQFNFLGSALSPLEVAVRDSATCGSCRTYDCIRGTRAGAAIAPQATPYNRLPVLQRGCELSLFQPRKVGNLDCTFCLDCVYACPHDNVGILPRIPAAELTASGTRSGIGAVERRFDLTALFTVFTFGALLNAFAMISPVYALERAIAEATSLRVEWPILGGIFVLALALEPALLLGGAAAIARGAAGSAEHLLAVINRFARSLVPLGFGIWLAHYGFHFFTGFLTIIPVTQNAVLQVTGSALLGAPLWQLGGLPTRAVLPLEMGFLSLGLIGSWIAAWSIAREFAPRRPARAFAPWAVMYAGLFVAAVWIMHQPMDMRGTFLGA